MSGAQHAVLNSSCTPSTGTACWAPQCELPRCCGERFRTRRPAVSPTAPSPISSADTTSAGNHDGGTRDKAGTEKQLSVTTYHIAPHDAPAASPPECACTCSCTADRSFSGAHTDRFATRSQSGLPALLCIPTSSLFPVCARAWHGCLFFDWRTLPARRSASKRCRFTDHGPRRVPPRSPPRPLRVFDPPLIPCWSLHAIENSTPPPVGTYGGCDD